MTLYPGKESEKVLLSEGESLLIFSLVNSESSDMRGPSRDKEKSPGACTCCTFFYIYISHPQAQCMT